MKLQADRFSRDGEFTDRPATHPQHRGLERTQEQWGQFRTPSLRHVAQTAPYMHDGRFSRLEQVLAHYSSLAGAVGLAEQKEKLLAPLHLSASETEDLIALLHALSSPMGSDPAGLQLPSP
jgi:cytochrome c peroxidase